MSRPSPKLSRAVLLLGPLLTLACSASEPPAHPSWDLDIYPLLRSACLHCHGDSYLAAGNPVRFDVCNRDALEFQRLGVANLGFGAATLSSAILASVKPTKVRARMPPAPAAVLSPYELELLERWVPLAVQSPELACRKQVPNRPPAVKRVGQPLATATSLWVTLEITDPDDDQVMGKATAGPASVDLTFMGRKMVELKNATPTDRLNVRISDGWITTEQSF
jgi:hypothetical protein